MKPTYSTILDPNPGLRGHIYHDGLYALVPYGDQYIVIHQGKQLRMCKTQQTGEKFINKHYSNRPGPLGV